MLDDFCRCERCYYFKYECKRRKIGSDNALVYGKAIHKACDCFFMGLSLKDAIKAFSEIMPKDFVPADEKRTIKMAHTIIREYYNQYANQPIDEVLGIEKTLKCEIAGVDFYGRIDKIVKWAYGISVLDHKTTTSYMSQFVERVDRSHQYTGYIHMMNELYPDDEKYGCIVDAIHIPRPLKTKPSVPAFERPIVIRSPEQIEDWKQWVNKCDNDIKWCQVQNVWPEEMMSCYSWNRPCPFMSICEIPSSLEKKVEYLKDSIDYEDYEWAPWDEVYNGETKEAV